MLLDPARIEAELQRLHGPLFDCATRGDGWVRAQEELCRRLRRGLREAAFGSIDAPLFAVQQLVDQVFFASCDVGLTPTWELLDAEAFVAQRLMAAPLPRGVELESMLRHASDFVRWLGALGRVSSSVAAEVVTELARHRVRVAFRLAG